ncbi:exodeoxyribonuclease VII large subunit [Virgibacillus sp. W0430]|uniref:exodeoxyribonuclease VII large subunit n=1 Tax=Virgibacillus sp. W0430 TaxID=3391580 RepID=UPI003F45633D
MKEKYLTVQALTKYMKRKIDTDTHLQGVWLKGEISNFNHHSRGHMYLTIKDSHARIQAVMFAGQNRSLKFTPENGMKVLLKGNISVFEPYGQYQLYIQEMEPDGLGALYLAFEQLKEKLAKEGYFNKRRKDLPLYPKHIGIITSPTGAAIRDILTTIKRRYPIVQTTVIPVIVQGDQAANSIEKAIKLANKVNKFDVLIVGRGGGSIEDLWAFNEEVVAKAIYYSNIPIISAVGHETDTTISDFAADIRASTPTGAAEISVPSRIELIEKLFKYKKTINHLLRAKISLETKQYQRIKQSYAFRYPVQLIQQKEQQLDQFTEKLKQLVVRSIESNNRNFTNMYGRLSLQHPERNINAAINRLHQLNKFRNTYMNQLFQKKVNENQRALEKLIILNPLEIMKRGFAIPYDNSQTIITSVKTVQENDQLIVKMHDGELDCKVSAIKTDDTMSGGI